MARSTKDPILSQRTRDLMLIGGSIATVGGVYYVYTLVKKPAEKALHTVVGSPSHRTTTVPVTPVHTLTKTVVHTVSRTQTVSRTTTARTPKASPTMTYRAPQQLPSYVTRRCGTVYISLGLWRNRAGLAYIAKYVDGVLVAQYPQPEPSPSPWLKSGTWSGGSTCASSASTFTYTVRYGDTLSGIAACTGSTVAQLAAMNHISNVNLITVGQVLKVPNPCVRTSQRTAAQLQVVSAAIQGVN